MGSQDTGEEGESQMKLAATHNALLPLRSKGRSGCLRPEIEGALAMWLRHPDSTQTKRKPQFLRFSILERARLADATSD